MTVVFKPNKVIAELGKRNVYALSAAEGENTLSCVSATGFIVPPMMIYPCKTCVPHKSRKVHSQTLHSKAVRVAGLILNCLSTGFHFF